MDILELAHAQRAAIIAEIGRLEAFLGRAEALLRDSQAVDARAPCPVFVGSNVIPLRRALSPRCRAATACETGE